MAGSFSEYGRLYATLPDVIIVPGAIVTHNTTPTIARGKGFTTSKNGTAIYRVTLNKKMGRVLFAVGILTGTTAVFLKKVAYSAGNNYVEFRVENASAVATEPAATAELEFIIIATRTKAPV